MKEYFELTMTELQIAAGWAVCFAEKTLDIYEKTVPGDNRPRIAVEGAKTFSISGKRTNILRKQAMDAYKASRETQDLGASYAANAASLAVAVAYTHPFSDIRQARHILGPVVFAALSIESDRGERSLGDEEIAKAIDSAHDGLHDLLRKFPEHINGDKRLDEIFYLLDHGIRMKFEKRQADVSSFGGNRI